MITYDYVCFKTKEHKIKTRAELVLDKKGRVPQSIKGTSGTFEKVMNFTALYKNETNEEILVNSIDYFLQMGVLPEKVIYIEEKPFKWEKNVDGIPNVADLSDTFRQLHDTKNTVKYTKPPLQADSKSWGYGLT